MKVQVRVKPNSRQESVEIQSDGTYVVRVNAPPIEGRANERVIELLAKHWGCPKSQVRLVSGGKSKLKTFELPE